MSTYFPDIHEFKRRAEKGNLTPVYKEILADMETPVSAFRKINKSDYSFLLESVEGGERMARYSFLGSGAGIIIKSKGKEVYIHRENSTDHIELQDGQDVLNILKEEMAKLKYVPDPNLPKFCGGAVGYFSYDLVRFFEKLPEDTIDDLNMPDSVFIFTDIILIFDHIQHKIRVVCNTPTQGDPVDAYNKATRKIDALIRQLKTPYDMSSEYKGKPDLDVQSNIAKEDFEEAVKKCKDYISSGDIIQVVLSQRFQTTVNAPPLDIYRALRSLNPSPYMFFLQLGETKLIGSSPEILVTCQENIATTRPIAGTRPRGKTIEEDNALQEELLADEKERAEHIMLVDLGRNDLGRVCKYGTVEVDELMVIEKYSHVMHIVSNVRGKLEDGYDQFDLLRAAFPAGTVSGAPKIRAMEIIEELEPTRRGPYAGAIGYFSYSGDMDTCITIRTILLRGNKAYVQAGAGIVADSVPEREYNETVNKAMAMVNALKIAEAGLE
ncbi:MAG: anthranilate synthase component I [Armatimonadota bacterium]